MICSKCNIDKPNEDYLTYYHSTDKKYYTRKVCKKCSAAQQREWRLKNKIEMELQLMAPKPEPVIESKPNHKIYLCTSCNEEKSEDEWYLYYDSKSRQKRSTYCRQCAIDKGKRSYSEALESGGGSTKVYSKPNTYVDDIQKQLTFDFLLSIGYLYNEAYGVWLKPGVKEIKLGSVFFPKVKRKKRKNRNENKRIAMTDEEINEIHRYYDEGLKVMDICRVLDRPQSTIYMIVKKYDPNYG